jgi:O-methyltransferase
MAVMVIRRAVRRLRGPARDVPDAGSIEEQLASLDPSDRPIVERALPYTLTGVARLHALVGAVRYCATRGVAGALAECGVWRGGSVLAMALTLLELGQADRDLYLYDTFDGMTAPSEHDVSDYDPPALETWARAERRGERPWSDVLGVDGFDQEAARELLVSAGYPEEHVHIVPGSVEQTLPRHAPEALALLRLDTDWYESTRHELEHLYPRLVDGGVLIVDDYGHWKGARRAVDEYFAANPPLLLCPIDYTARIAIKH